MNITNRISPNRTAGREARIDRLVWHHTGGNFQGALNWIVNPASQVSYHYMIDRNGAIWRTVHEGDTAWHAGTWAMNSRSIGICGETGGWTNAARNSFAALTRDICGRRGLPIDRSIILAHRQVMQTACPGDLPIDAWVAFAASGAATGGAELNAEERNALMEVLTLCRWMNPATDQTKWQVAAGSWHGHFTYLHEAAVRTGWINAATDQTKWNVVSLLDRVRAIEDHLGIDRTQHDAELAQFLHDVADPELKAVDAPPGPLMPLPEATDEPPA